MTADEYLASRCFYCEKLKARISPKQCAYQQSKLANVVTLWGNRVKQDLSMNAHCSSGTCQQGKKYLGRE
jgi:hypothetical protein